jgi:hypothetical protein
LRRPTAASSAWMSPRSPPLTHTFNAAPWFCRGAEEW